LISLIRNRNRQQMRINRMKIKERTSGKKRRKIVDKKWLKNREVIVMIERGETRTTPKKV